MADWYRVIDQDRRVIDSGSLDEGKFIFEDENGGQVIVLAVKGRVIIPMKWLAFQSACGNLRTKVQSTVLQETISGRWMLKAIQYGLQHPTPQLKFSEEALKEWDEYPDFALISTKGADDFEIRVPSDMPIEVWDKDYETMSDGGRRLFYFRRYASFNIAWKDGLIVAQQQFKDYLDEKRFNQTMVNMCQDKITLERMLQFKHPLADPKVDALLYRQA